jgi:DNA-binding response OmpR family regulator
VSAPLPSTPQPQRARSAQTRVLVVEDDRPTLEVLEALLQTSGYAVHQAADARAAVAAFRAQPFDVVLVDIGLPDQSGLMLAGALRALPQGDRAALVLMSASRDGETRLQAVHSGADDFLPKPLDITEVLLRVRSLVRLKRLRDDLDQRGQVVRAQHAALMRAQEERRHLNAMIVHDLKGPLSVLLANVRSRRTCPSSCSRAWTTRRLRSRRCRGGLRTIWSNPRCRPRWW